MTMSDAATAARLPVIDDVPFAQLLEDPYPVYARARALGPAVRIAAADLILVTRFDDIIAIERDPETFSSDNPASRVVKLFGTNLMRKDGEAHRRERLAIEPALRPGAATRCWGPLLAQIVEEALGRIEARGAADLFEDFAAPIAGRALAAIVGFSDVDWRDVARWSQAMMDGAGNYGGDPAVDARALAAGAEIEAAVDRAVGQGAEGESLIASMLAAGLTRQEIYGNVKVAVGGGYNEPRDAILSLALGLLTNPDQRDAVLADPALWQPAFEEAARWISPIGMYPRILTRDAEVGGVTLPKGTQIGLSVAAANHDPARFASPERFDLRRPKSSHLAFGSGPHFCAGTWVARVFIARIAAPALFGRLKGLRLAGAAPVRGWVFRGPTALPVEWDSCGGEGA